MTTTLKELTLIILALTLNTRNEKKHKKEKRDYKGLLLKNPRIIIYLSAISIDCYNESSALLNVTLGRIAFAARSSSGL